MDRREHVDGAHGLGHAVLRREEVEVEDAAVVLDDHGLVAEEGDALELEQRVVQRVLRGTVFSRNLVIRFKPN